MLNGVKFLGLLEALYSVFSCHRKFQPYTFILYIYYLLSSFLSPPSSPFSCSSILHPLLFLLFSPAVMLQPFDPSSTNINKHKFMVQTMFAPADCSPQQLDAIVRIKGVAGRIKGLHNVMFDVKTVTRLFAACRMLQVCVG